MITLHLASMIAFRDLLAAGSSRQDLPPGASGEGLVYVFAGALALPEGKPFEII